MYNSITPARFRPGGTREGGSPIRVGGNMSLVSGSNLNYGAASPIRGASSSILGYGQSH